MIATALIGPGIPAHAATDPAAACKDAKAKTAGKKAADLLKAFGKNLKKADPVKLTASVSKAQSKLTKGFDKAESKAGCASVADVGSIEAKVDAFAADAISEIDGSGPTCDCCAGSPATLSFTTGVGAGVCGQVQNFRCSNNTNGACADDTDCDFGACIDPPGICGDDFTVMCSGSGSPCTGTCGEIIALNLPLDLDCGGLYTGGGSNTVPLPIQIPDQAQYVMNITSCAGNAVSLGAATAADTGSTRTCTEGKKCSGTNASCVLDADCPAAQTCEDRCFFGPPLPIPNANNVNVSVCSVNVIQNDAVGVVACSNGDTTTSVPLAGKVFLTGDLLDAVTPPNVPGIQPCPLCVRQCAGGTNDRFPCADNGECDSGTCGGAPQCLGGPDDGNACTPASSPLNEALPTSQDCGSDPLLDVTANIGGLPIDFAAITGTDVRNAVDNGTASARVFCGFCRDRFGGGSLCFEGATSGGCPAALPAATGIAVSCSSNADCMADADEYETCEQRNPGAFSEAAATRLTLDGSTDGQCLDDLATHDATLVYLFCIPPTFDATIDAAGDLPGPGAASLSGLQQLQ
jgi:hypothetical protein